MKNYIPPIDLFYRDMQTRLEEEVFEAVYRVGIIVDREELMKALAYDREQYEAGYADGRRDEWIPADDWPPESDGRYLMATDRGEMLVGEWKDGMLRCKGSSMTTAVKWWMPAPELPEELE